MGWKLSLVVALSPPLLPPKLKTQDSPYRPPPFHWRLVWDYQCPPGDSGIFFCTRNFVSWLVIFLPKDWKIPSPSFRQRAWTALGLNNPATGCPSPSTLYLRYSAFVFFPIIFSPNVYMKVIDETPPTLFLSLNPD